MDFLAIIFLPDKEVFQDASFLSRSKRLLAYKAMDYAGYAVRIPLCTHDLVMRAARAGEIGRTGHVEGKDGKDGTHLISRAGVYCLFIPAKNLFLADWRTGLWRL